MSIAAIPAENQLSAAAVFTSQSLPTSPPVARSIMPTSRLKSSMAIGLGPLSTPLTSCTEVTWPPRAATFFSRTTPPGKRMAIR